MSPSRALLDGVLKYKRLHRDRAGDKNHFIYDDQADLLEFCFGARDLTAALADADTNQFKSLECQVMDFADDIAYSCFDLVDGARARFLTPDRLRAWGERRKMDGLPRGQLGELVEMMTTDKLQPKMNGIIGELIQGASLEPAENFMTARTHRHAYAMRIAPAAKARIDLHKAISKELIFGSSALQQIEFKGGHVLRELCHALFANYLEADRPPLLLVPEEVHRALGAAGTKPARARLLCDHLSGMTDAYALRSYKRLFDPDYGSISELI